MAPSWSPVDKGSATGVIPDHVGAHPVGNDHLPLIHGTHSKKSAAQAPLSRLVQTLLPQGACSLGTGPKPKCPSNGWLA